MQMDSIRVDGGVCLRGKVRIQGSKNAALPILAATLLTKGENIISNCPKITDVYQMKQLLKSIGCEVRERSDNSCYINAENVRIQRMPADAVRGMRSSVCMLGAMLGRFGEVMMEYPGGCVIGERPIDMHLDALEKMGAVFSVENGLIQGRVPGGFHGADVRFSKVSVGATENALLAAVLAEGDTVIYGAAKEPEVVSLCDYLVECGAKIQGCGTTCLKIEGVKELQGAKAEIVADRIVAGTYMFAAMAAKGEVWLEQAPCHHLEEVVSVVQRMGAVCQTTPNGLYIQAPENVKTISFLRTGIYPDFPTDLQSAYLVASLRGDDDCMIEEAIFENRFHIVEPLCSMGADITILDKKRVFVKGGATLVGKSVEAKELRGGAALVLAGLMANGVTIVKGSNYIMRGYENICKDLRELGARIVSV